MPATPLVSIITPVKNAARWLPECLLSVQEQDLEDWQWIIIDDHSTDQSAAIIKQAAAKDQRIILESAHG
jgi:glycosyltransferase involved in cell wall biosynthesis